jgi:outer membrane protein
MALKCRPARDRRAMSFLVACLTGFALLLNAQAAFAKEKGDLLVRLRAIGFMPDSGGGTDQLGGDADVGNAVVPELDFTYFFTKNIAAELILATTQHSVSLEGSSSGKLDLGRVNLLPPHINLQYHFMPDGKFSPYLGAGVGYVFFYKEKAGSSINSIDYKNSVSWSLQAGVDYKIDDRWSLNLDLKKVFVDTELHINGGGVTAGDIDLNPWVVGIGVGYRF